MKLTPEEIAAAIGAEVLAEGEAELAAPGGDRLGRGRARRPLLRPARRQPRRRRVRPGGDRGRRLGRGRRTRVAFVLCRRTADTKDERRAWVFVVEDPLAAMQALARAWRRALGARVVGVTGSVGKTSVKDIARALLPGRVHANRENLNTEIGLPLTILEAPEDTETAGAGDGDARRRPDRRAGGDRRARGGGDHQRRPGPRRAARLGRGDRRGEGRDPRRPAAGRDRGRAGRGRRAGAAPGRRSPRLLRFGPGGDVEASRGRRSPTA